MLERVGTAVGGARGDGPGRRPAAAFAASSGVREGASAGTVGGTVGGTRRGTSGKPGPHGTSNAAVAGHRGLGRIHRQGAGRMHRGRPRHRGAGLPERGGLPGASPGTCLAMFEPSKGTDRHPAMHPAPLPASGSASDPFEAQSRGLHALCVRSRGRPRTCATLDSGWGPALSGRDSHPLGRVEGFRHVYPSTWLPPSPSFAWRKNPRFSATGVSLRTLRRSVNSAFVIRRRWIGEA